MRHGHIPDFPTDELFVVLEGTDMVTEAGLRGPDLWPAGDAFVIRRGIVCDF